MPRPFLHQLIIMWLPLVLVFWFGFSIIRKANRGRQREIFERNMVHMDALERKLDPIIELLERPPGR